MRRGGGGGEGDVVKERVTGGHGRRGEKILTLARISSKRGMFTGWALMVCEKNIYVCCVIGESISDFHTSICMRIKRIVCGICIKQIDQ